MFAAKAVPLELLDHIERERDFHEENWDRVVQDAREELKSFQSYFDYVVALARQLQTSGDV
jgi:hypothetical protein